MNYTLAPQLAIGQRFEQSVANLLTIKGWSVSFNQSKDLSTLKKYDLWAKKEDKSVWIEVKLDAMSQTTGNVCIEIGALRHSQSPVFIIGLPSNQWTDIYKMPLKTILRYAESYPVKKLVGQWSVESALIPKDEFVRLPFVKRFTTEEPLDPYGLRKWKSSTRSLSPAL